MELSRKNIANIAVMFGIKPGNKGREKLRKLILRKIKCAEEQARKEAFKITAATDKKG